MKINDISKIQAAEKQLKTAIDLFFRRGDPISIHTLVWAAHEIIQALAQKEGVNTMKTDALKIIREDKRKVFINAMNKPGNFFKHADRDHNSSIEFNPELTEILLWDAVRVYYFLTKRKVPLFIAYDIWAYSKYPALIKLTPEEDKKQKEIIGDITYENKEYFLNWVDEYDSSIKKNVKPTDLMIRFSKKEFGPQSTFFNLDTRVWSSIYALNEQDIMQPSEELIFNFYLNNQWSDNITAEKVALTFLNSTKLIIGKPFTAPDNVTKEPAYCIMSYSTSNNLGYLNITKICSIRNNVFAFTYSKKFVGSGEVLLNNINYWLIKDFESNVGAINESNNIGVDGSWIDYFTGENKNHLPK